MEEGRYYSNVKELMETSDVVKANELLSEGWELLTIKEEGYVKADEGKVVTETRPVYIFGKVSEKKLEEASSFSQIKWVQSTKNKRLEYAKNAPRELLEQIRKAGRLKAGIYIYTAHRTDPVIFRIRRDAGNERTQ